MAKAADTASTSDRDDADTDLTLDDLIAFGRDYLEALEAGAGIHLPKDVLNQYLTRANGALVLLQREQARKKPKKPRSTGGRPAGASMGEDVLRLMANGMGEQQALRLVAKKRDKPRPSVLRSYTTARKKPPR